MSSSSATSARNGGSTSERGPDSPNANFRGIKDEHGRWISSHVINQDISAWVGQGRIADRTALLAKLLAARVAWAAADNADACGWHGSKDTADFKSELHRWALIAAALTALRCNRRDISQWHCEELYDFPMAPRQCVPT